MSQSNQGIKGQGEVDKPQDPFLLDRIYKDPLAAFLHKPLPVGEFKDDCLIFLDTNVLLIPYNTSKDSLKSFTDIYKKLSDDGRLYLADRVMQEFEKNVPEKLKNIFRSISLGQNYNAQSIDFPLLDGLAEYADLKLAEKAFKDYLEQFRKASKATLDAIEGWGHNDPVRSIYRTVFKNAKAAKIISLSSEELLKSWRYRSENKIPPGYKDAGKDDSGIGDYLFWQSVLDTCAKEKMDAIVISSDSKPDWWHNSDGKALYARRELVEEFREATGGKTVKLLSPANFLKLFEATKDVIEEVAIEQQLTAPPLQKISDDDILMARSRLVGLAEKWLKSIVNAKRVGPNIFHAKNASGIQEYKVVFFINVKGAYNRMKIYQHEESTADRRHLILVGVDERAVLALGESLGDYNGFGFNLILGCAVNDEFTPMYSFNTI